MSARPLLLVLVVLLAACGGGSGGTDVLPDAPAALYAPDPGPRQAAAPAWIELFDAARDKPLAIRVDLPAGDDVCPLILWSHGYLGSRDAYDPLVERWVSHGYVCIRFTHSDSLAIPAEDRAAFEDWASRPADLSFVLDSLDEIEAAVPALLGRVDRARIGAGGHSFGAGTANLLGGARTVLGQSFLDPRILAALLVSPQGEGELLGPRSWDDFANPMLVLTGTLDDSDRTGNDWTWRLDPYTHASAGRKHLVVIDGAYHDFGGISGASFPGQGPRSDDHVLWVRSATTAFFDAYVKGSETARAWLASEALTEATDGAVDVDWK
jgi:dienelactone hydrolase